MLLLFAFIFGTLSCQAKQIDCDRYGYSDFCDPLAHPFKTVIADYDFNKKSPIFQGPNADFTNYQFGIYTAADGSFTTGCHGGVVNSNPFETFVVASPADRYKFVASVITPVDVPAHGKINVDWIGSAEVFKTEDNPYPEEILQGPNDPRLAAGIFYIGSTQNNMNFAFGLTNDRVYALYERFYNPLATPAGYGTFAFLVPIAKRKPCDWHKMRITVDSILSHVIYYYEGKEVWRITKPGRSVPGMTPIMLTGGVEADVFPEDIIYGFGTTTFLSAYPGATKKDCNHDCDQCNYPLIREGLCYLGYPISYNPVIGEPVSATFFDPVGSSQLSHIWGQGVVLRIKQLKVVEEEVAH